MRRKIIQYFLEKKGMTIAAQNGPSFSACLQRLKRRGLHFATIIDVGASDGSWTADALRVFPGKRSLCIEAQKVHERALIEFCQANENVSYVRAAAAEREGEINFEASDPFGGAASEQQFLNNNEKVKAVTIDGEIKRRSLPGPFLIKLDTHGFEIPILMGAFETLSKTAALVIECYNFKICSSALTFPQFCLEMEKRGFRCADLFDPLYRPKDGLLWQFDLVFLPADRPEFADVSYA